MPLQDMNTTGSDMDMRGTQAFPQDISALDWQDLVQAVLLHCGLLDDRPGPETLGTGLSNEGTTLREMRRTGALSELSLEARSTLLGGALFRYCDTVPPMTALDAAQLAENASSAPSSHRHTGTDSTASEATQPLPGFAETALSTLRSNLHALRFNSRDSRRTSALSSASPVPVETLRPGTRSSSISGSLSMLEDELDDDAQAQPFGDAPSPAGSSVLDLPPPVELQLPATASETSGLFANALRSGMDSGDTALNTFRSTGGLWRSERTALGDTLESGEVMGESVNEGVSGRMGESGLIGVLWRLATDGSSMDDSLLRSVHRVLQLGTVLAGARLSDEEIDALPKVRFDLAEESDCAICLEAFSRGDLLTTLPCSHFFHVDCLAKWLRRSAQCPLCRSDQVAM